MNRLSVDVCLHISTFLGRFAPTLGPWAEVSKEMSVIIRLAYCQHCGRMRETGDQFSLVTTKDGTRNITRAKHRYPCTFPTELDPFRHLYPLFPSNYLFTDGFIMAGGWPAFLHFREHCKYIQPWRRGGETTQHDLDVFYFNNSAPVVIDLDRHAPYPMYNWNLVLKNWEVSKEQSGSRWVDGKATTEPNHDWRLVFRSKQVPSFTLHVDLIGKFTKRAEDVWDVFDEMDLPWCRVGFKIVNGIKTWYHNRLTSSIVVDDWCEEVSSFERLESSCHCAKNTKKRCREEEEERSIDRLTSRLLKYNRRGYTLHKMPICECCGDREFYK